MSTEERPVQIVADQTLDSPRIYANYVQVNVSPIDCTLTFCDVIGPQSEEEALKVHQTGILRSPVQAVVVIPNQIIEGLVHALKIQTDKQSGMDKPPSGTVIQ